MPWRTARGACSTAWAELTGRPPRVPLDARAHGAQEDVGDPREGARGNWASSRVPRKARWPARWSGSRAPGSRSVAQRHENPDGGGRTEGVRGPLWSRAREAGVRPRPAWIGPGGRSLGRPRFCCWWPTAPGAGAAAAALDAACEVFHPEAVVSTGFCGALDPELNSAVASVASGDGGGERPPRLAARSRQRRHAPTRGTIWCPSIAWRRRPPRKSRCAASGACAVEMEAAGVAARAAGSRSALLLRTGRDRPGGRKPGQRFQRGPASRRPLRYNDNS